jgi:uncharacterized protein (TIGR03067 family)
VKAKVLVTLAAALVLVGSPVAANGEEDEAAVKKELAKWQGLWTFESLEKDGKPMPAEKLKNRTIFFGADRYLVRLGGDILQIASQKLYPTETPTALDVKILAGPDKDETMLGIYELKGDTLRVCLDSKGKARPKAFKTTANSGLVLAVYRRARPLVQDEPDITGSYLCEGVLLDGNKYKAKVEIQKLGDAYMVRWTRGIAEAHIGVGIRKGNLLSVCFAAGRGGAGIVVYQIDKGPRLVGEWTDLGGIGIVQSETLMRETEKKSDKVTR